MMRKFKAIDIEIGGIKCDAPNCHYHDDSIKLENYRDWVNKPCPKCGANLLTEACNKQVLTFVKFAKIMNIILFPFMVITTPFRKPSQTKNFISVVDPTTGMIKSLREKK